MDKILVLVSGITTVFTFVFSIYKLIFKEGREREENYYQTVLKPYIFQYIKCEEIDTINVIKTKIKRNDNNVPPYVFYLVDEGIEEDLRRVLIYDYMTIYPNDANRLGRIMEFILKIIFYLFFTLSVLSMLICTFFLSYGLLDTLSAIVNALLSVVTSKEIVLIEWNEIFATIVCGLIFEGVSVTCIKLANAYNIDRYTIKKKKIQGIIKRTLRKYEKNIDKYFL